MREIRTSGSEGGAGRKPRSYLYQSANAAALRASQQNPLYRGGGLDAGGFLVEALEAEGEAVVVHAEAVEEGGIGVADADRVFDDVVGVVVGAAVTGAAIHAAACEPGAETTAQVVRPLGGRNQPCPCGCGPKFM